MPDMIFVGTRGISGRFFLSICNIISAHANKRLTLLRLPFWTSSFVPLATCCYLTGAKHGRGGIILCQARGALTVSAPIRHLSTARLSRAV